MISVKYPTPSQCDSSWEVNKREHNKRGTHIHTQGQPQGQMDTDIGQAQTQIKKKKQRQQQTDFFTQAQTESHAPDRWEKIGSMK